MTLFEKFATGKLLLAAQKTDLKAVPWSPHAQFDGVALKHLITAKDTNGEFSYHLVSIEPQKKIGLHIHEVQLETHEVISGNGICDISGHELVYEVGSISIIPAGAEHEVIAGKDGLFLFAKFFPALC